MQPGNPGLSVLQCCGKCIMLGPVGEDALEEYSKCRLQFKVPGPHPFQPRVLPWHGTECPFFVKKPGA